MTDEDVLFPSAVDAFLEAYGDCGQWNRAADGLRAALKVYDDVADRDLDDIMARCGFAGMDIDKDVQIRLKYAHEIAAAMVHGFDELIRVRGAENYIEQEMTVTDPALEQAIEAGKPQEEWPAHRQYRIIIVAPGRPSPHELRRNAQTERDEALRLLAQTKSALHVALSYATVPPGHPHAQEASDELDGCRHVLTDVVTYIAAAARSVAAAAAKEGDRP